MQKLCMSATIALIAIGFIPGEPEIVVAPAEAIVGRPLSPVSVAGVARRTTRRAVVYGAAAAPVYAAPTTVVVAAPPASNCVTKYDAYGSKVTTCTSQ